MLESTPHQLREFLSRHIDQLKASLQGREPSKVSLSKNTQFALLTAPLCYSSLPALHHDSLSTIMRTVRSCASNSLLALPCTWLLAPSNGMDSHEPSHQPMINKEFCRGLRPSIPARATPRFPRELHSRRQPPTSPPTPSPIFHSPPLPPSPTPSAQPAPPAQPATRPPPRPAVNPSKSRKQSMWSWTPMTSGGRKNLVRRARVDFYF